VKVGIEIVQNGDLDFTKVRYYTLKYIDQDKSEIDKFYEKYSEEYPKSVYFLKMWIQEIGEYKGALPQYFRKEDTVSALPPPAEELRRINIDGYQEKTKLRLYCIVLSPSVVLLVNGGIKESKLLKDSPTCYEQYIFTGSILNQINRMKRYGNLEIKEKDIICSSAFNLTY